MTSFCGKLWPNKVSGLGVTARDLRYVSFFFLLHGGILRTSCIYFHHAGQERLRGHLGAGAFQPALIYDPRSKVPSPCFSSTAETFPDII